MMQNISRKTEKVAEFPLKLNLQLFGEDDGTPSLEDSPEFESDAREFNAKMDTYVTSRTSDDTTKTEPVDADKAEKPEVVEPEKQKQDSETNKAFQEMRKQLEAEKARASEIEAKAKKADELIAQQYGDRGIFTVEQYEAALQREREEENARRYEESGLTAEEVEAIRNYKSVQQQVHQYTQERTQAQVTDQWNQLYSSYPELVESSKVIDSGSTPDWYTPEMQAEISRGASPLAAYRNAHFETILNGRLQNAQAVAKQEALDKLNSKEHLAPNASTGGEVDHVEIDEETMRAYRALNKGKSDAQIRAWHKKHAN